MEIWAVTTNILSINQLEKSWGLIWSKGVPMLTKLLPFLVFYISQSFKVVTFTPESMCVVQLSMNPETLSFIALY